MKFTVPLATLTTLLAFTGSAVASCGSPGSIRTSAADIQGLIDVLNEKPSQAYYISGSDASEFGKHNTASVTLQIADAKAHGLDDGDIQRYSSASVVIGALQNIQDECCTKLNQQECCGTSTITSERTDPSKPNQSTDSYDKDVDRIIVYGKLTTINVAVPC